MYAANIILVTYINYNSYRYTNRIILEDFINFALNQNYSRLFILVIHYNMSCIYIF